MKNKIITFSLLFIVIMGFSQSRVNPKKSLEIGEFKVWVKSSEVLGWDFNNEEWKSRKGYLRVGDDVGFLDINEKYNLPIDEIKSRTNQNFNEIGVLSVNFEENNYIGVGVEKIGGRYQYPSIREDWYYYNNYYIFVFDKDELEKLNSFDGVIELTPILGAYGDSLKRDTKFQSCYENVKYLLENGSYYQWKFILKKTTNGENDVVRFLLPQKIKSYGKSNLLDFENHYFEVSLDKFNDLLITINKI